MQFLPECLEKSNAAWEVAFVKVAFTKVALMMDDVRRHAQDASSYQGARPHYFTPESSYQGVHHYESS